MSALYRQARPTTFDEMVGQEHVKEVLYSALAQGKLAQAYLFSGPRGVGKTSSARLIAQAVNCTASTKPCGQCEGCQLVRSASHPDVLEIDAASSNSVEDVRDLRELVLLAPIVSQHKVIILDEAHMMSKSAFNALLKTLEEPPQHVIFVFATTEPEKMPATILSRTQHFKFKRLSEAQIAQKLTRIVQQLERSAQPAALELVARMADGAMRDAESLLDRLLTTPGDITLEGTEQALGLPPQQQLMRVVQAFSQQDVAMAISTITELYQQGYAAKSLGQALIEAFRSLLYSLMGIGGTTSIALSQQQAITAMTTLDGVLDRLQKRSDALALELALLAAYEAVFPTQNAAQIQPIAVPVHTQPVRNSAPAPTPQPAAPALPDFSPAPSRPAPQAVQSTSAGSSADFASDWRLVLQQLKTTIRAFYREATPYLEPHGLVLVFAEDRKFHYERAQKHLEDIQQAVRGILGDYSIELRMGKKKPESQSNAPAVAFDTVSKPEVEPRGKARVQPQVESSQAGFQAQTESSGFFDAPTGDGSEQVTLGVTSRSAPTGGSEQVTLPDFSPTGFAPQKPVQHEPAPENNQVPEPLEGGPADEPEGNWWEHAQEDGGAQPNDFGVQSESNTGQPLEKASQNGQSLSRPETNTPEKPTESELKSNVLTAQTASMTKDQRYQQVMQLFMGKLKTLIAHDTTEPPEDISAEADSENDPEA